MFRIGKLLLNLCSMIAGVLLLCNPAFSAPEAAHSTAVSTVDTSIHPSEYYVEMSETPFTWHQVKHDYKNYYSHSNLMLLTGGFAVAAVIANSPIDQKIRNYYQEHLRNGGTNAFSTHVKPLGSPYVVLGYVGAWAIGRMIPQNHTANIVGEWGNLSLRALAVGLPPMWLMQNVTGSYRPDENQNSYWHPFVQDHGVSGHAFMGAIPFLTAAELTPRTGFRYLLYAASAMTGFSRINDDEHYFSQVLLGWWMADLAVRSVAEKNHTTLLVTPEFVPGGVVASVCVPF